MKKVFLGINVSYGASTSLIVDNDNFFSLKSLIIFSKHPGLCI